ncbi:hypothetical protein V5O48_011566 [Marasmius crinis-equi]|uniref:Uncharacterized protein n=1 Tax=Marasmius crinis-equi TaxID=585013 RepID=A0ABR3F5P3_9AGAR
MSFTLNTADWRKPTITLSRSQRIQIAQSAIEKALSNLAGDGRFPDNDIDTAHLYSDMAEFDLLSNKTQYEDQLARYLQSWTGDTLSSGLILVRIPSLFLCLFFLD